MTACAIRAHFAEFGIIVGQDRQLVDGLVDWLEDEELKLPARERVALAVLVNQLTELERQVEAIEPDRRAIGCTRVVVPVPVRCEQQIAGGHLVPLAVD